MSNEKCNGAPEHPQEPLETSAETTPEDQSVAAISADTKIAMNETVRETSPTLVPPNLLPAFASKVGIMNSSHNFEEMGTTLKELCAEFPDYCPEITDFSSENIWAARKKLAETVHISLKQASMKSSLDNMPDGGFAGCEGKVEKDDNDVYKIQIDDTDNLVGMKYDEKQIMAAFHETLQEFRKSGDLFKAYVTISPGRINISMDPGKHKEYLAVLFTPDHQAVITYEHIYSNMDKDQLPDSPRRKFIIRVLESAGISVTEHNNGIVGFVKTATPERMFKLLFRLCRSVKDLDINLRSKRSITEAVSAFSLGATNIENFLRLCNIPGIENPAEAVTAPHASKTVNERETAILLEHFKKIDEQLDAKKTFAQILQKIREAKDLNYEIIANLLDLQEKGRKVLAGADPLGSRRYNLKGLYNSIVAKLKKMRGLIPLWPSQDLDIHWLATKFEDAVTIFDEAARGKDTPDLSIYAAEFRGIFEDKGGELEKPNDVDTLEEAVRYFHSMLYSNMVTDQRELIGYWHLDPFCNSVDEVSGMPVLDLTEKGLENAPIFKTVQSTIKKIGRGCRRDLTKKETNTGRSTVMIIGDDYIAISCPQGKHRIEIEGQAKTGENPEHGINIRHFETTYPGAQQRIQFLTDILDELGFSPADHEPLQRQIHMNYRTESRAEWEKTLGEIIRLAYAATDLDIVQIGEPAYARKLFFDGVTNISMLVKYFAGLENKKESPETKREACRIIAESDYSGKNELMCLARLLTAKPAEMETLILLLSPLKEQEKNRIIDCIYDLMFQAEEAKNLKESKRLDRILRKLDKAGL